MLFTRLVHSFVFKSFPTPNSYRTHHIPVMKFLFLPLGTLLSVILVLLIGLIVARYYRLKNVPGGLSFFPRLKQNLLQISTDFVRLNLVIIILLMIFRSAQYLFLSYHLALPAGSILLEWHGFVHDLVTWQFISWILLIPFTMFSLLKRWAGIFFFGIIFLAYAAFELALFEYFSIALTPLDEVVFSYSLKEMIMIAENSVRISFLSFVPFITLLLLTPGLILISLKVRMPKYLLTVFILISLSLIAFSRFLVPDESGKRNPFEYFIEVNKSAYLFQKCTLHFAESKQSASMSQVDAAAKRYQAQHTEFNFPGTKYPFLHYDKTPDVLGSFFNLRAEKPNLVIIIVESLSSCFSGNNKVFGSFTPFLDSLAGHSLYWPNFLSTADRTFNVIEAITGSMPPGFDSFIIPKNDATYPYVMSLVSYLQKDGYYTSFYHGGDPSFNNMDDFLERQRTDYVLRSFGPRYRKVSPAGGSAWGFSDSDMFNRSFEVQDSMKKSPRLDIYLTVSTHTPFTIPNPEHYLSLVEERIKNPAVYLLAKDDLKNHKVIFSAIMYSDHALKEYMENARKRPGYDNTIFLITGDHAMPELNPGRVSPVERFHVPMIIFSPMLKKSATFLSISSHLDITPSVLALLHNNFGLEINPFASWLGSGIDTTSFFRNTHAFPFILNSREIPDYLDHLCYLSPYALFQIPPEFLLEEINNPAVKTRLKRELEDVKILSKHVLQQNKLVPPEVYYGKVLSCDTLKIHNQTPFSPADSTWEYKNFSDRIPVGSKFRLIKIKVTVDFISTTTHPDKPPKMVFELQGKGGKRIVYNSFEVSRDLLETSKPGAWKTASFTEDIDLSYLKGNENYFLLLYMWNQNRCNFRMTNPQVKIYGYY